MKNLFLLSIVFCAVLSQGCAPQILGEQIRKGLLVREEGTGVFSENTTRSEIELISPVAVRVFEETASTEITKKYFQQILVRQEAVELQRSYLDIWVKVLVSTMVLPIFTKEFWVEGSYLGVNCKEEPEKCLIRDVAHAATDAYIIENGSRSKTERRINIPPSATVSWYINGRYQGELKMNPDGTATASLTLPAETASNRTSMKLTFKYRDAYAYSTLRQDEQGNISVQRAAPENR